MQCGELEFGKLIYTSCHFLGLSFIYIVQSSSIFPLSTRSRKFPSRISPTTGFLDRPCLNFSPCRSVKPLTWVKRKKLCWIAFYLFSACHRVKKIKTDIFVYQSYISFSLNQLINNGGKKKSMGEKPIILSPLPRSASPRSCSPLGPDPSRAWGRPKGS